MAPKPRPAIERFLHLIQPVESGCWEWTGYIHKNGYARHWVDGKNVSAHRWSYEHHVGPIPRGMQIDHLCRNRACVNPDHLEPVTPSENVRRSTNAEAAAERASRVVACPEGHVYDDGNTYRSSSGRACLTCKKERSRASYLRNREQTIERARQWRADNPERAREVGREAQRRYRAKKKGQAA